MLTIHEIQYGFSIVYPKCGCQMLSYKHESTLFGMLTIFMPCFWLHCFDIAIV